ncbi:MAG: succinate dehydrogenase cytochrome b556 subunit [Nitrospirae bacterium]|nr:MAG: succinate dehydrogenase cytochrome b556 subunit [Nitrospirota bacterium]
MATAPNECTCSCLKVLDNPVAKKMLMALTGFGLVGFLFIHLIGNMSLYAGPGGINVYGQTLHALPPIVWAFRGAMLLLFVIHVWLGIKVTLENQVARPTPYARREYLKVTFASRTMIWTGAVIALILVYHILHFTIQMLYPDTAANALKDVLGRPDVYTMVVASFKKAGVALLYVVWMFAVALHVSHGFHSGLQTLGLASEKTLPLWTRLALCVAAFFFIAYTSIPASILAGMVN